MSVKHYIFKDKSAGLLDAASAEMSAALEAFQDRKLAEFEALAGRVIDDAESPIEVRLGLHLLGIGDSFCCAVHLGGYGATAETAPYLNVTQQHEIGGYRVDFLVEFIESTGTRHRVVVECDGHDFHERTKEQAARDRKRDRKLLALGYPTLRFTGSEIFRDARGCAAEVELQLFEMWIAAHHRRAHG